MLAAASAAGLSGSTGELLHVLAGGRTSLLRLLWQSGKQQQQAVAAVAQQGVRAAVLHHAAQLFSTRSTASAFSQASSQCCIGSAASAVLHRHQQHKCWPSSISSSQRALGPANDSYWQRPFSRGLFSSPASASSAADDSTPDAPRRRRRSATESNAVLRRTTESRAAIEDVAVMSRSQLLRRNKPWLKEQCWQHGLPHEGLKEDLIQNLLAWQDTDAGHAAAAAAQAAASAARAAIAAAMSATPKAPPAAAAVPASPQAGGAAAPHRQDSSSSPSSTAAHAAAVVPSATTAAVITAGPEGRQPPERLQVARPGGACAVAVAMPAEDLLEPTESDETVSTSSTRPAAEVEGETEEESAPAAARAAEVGWQAPRSASAAAADSMGLFLAQLQQQPNNAALVAAARNAVEQYATQFVSSAAGADASSMGQLVAQLAAAIAQHSTPQSLAALAKACYSREVQHPVLAASLAETVAAVAAQLGPQEVYGVLRLLVEHLGLEAEDPVGFRTMDKGFRVLAEAMIRCSEALRPVQLAEAVQLLAVHKYDDAFGLWLIAKEAAARLTEFDPVKEGASVVQLLDAIAGMCVADEAMTADVAAAVGARRGEYSSSQLAAIAAALERMGCKVEW